MNALLLAFARGEPPHAAGVPEWPRFEAARPRMLQLGAQVEVISWPNAAALALLAGGNWDIRPAAPRAAPRD
jgi:hypothetical protein